MSDSEDAQIKTEIDEIMKGVKNIMQKIEAIAPKDETASEDKDDPEASPNSSDISSTGKS